MNVLTSQNPFALSVLLDDDIYVIPEASVLDIDASIDKNTNQVILNNVIDPDKLISFGAKNGEFLFVVSENDYPVCAPTERELFAKICASFNINKEIYTILNLATNPIHSFQEWVAYFKPSCIIFFGAIDFDLHLPLNELTEKEIYKLLKTNSLKELNVSREAKLALWKEIMKIKK